MQAKNPNRLYSSWSNHFSIALTTSCIISQTAHCALCMLRKYCALATAFAALRLSAADAPGASTTGLSLPAKTTALQFERGAGAALASSRALHLCSSVVRKRNSPDISAVRRRSHIRSRTPSAISDVVNGPNTSRTLTFGLSRNEDLCAPNMLVQPLCASFTVPWGRSADFFFRVRSSNLWLVPVNFLLRSSACALRYGTFGSHSAELNFPTNILSVNKCNNRRKYEPTPHTLDAGHSRSLLTARNIGRVVKTQRNLPMAW